MDAADLRVFEAVARLGAMSRAAAELHTVQSNVTTRVRLLEDELGATLFRRHAHGVELTAAGRRLLPFAARVQRLLDEARRAAQDQSGPAGPLRVGSLETTAGVRLVPVFSGFAATYPEVDLSLDTGTTAELIQAVLAHRLEGAFVCGPVNRAELEAEAFFHEELAIITPPAVRTLEELTARPDLKIVVLRAGCSYRERLEQFLTRRGISGHRRQLESGTIAGVIDCVTAGLGMSLLPKSVAEAHQRGGRLAVHALPAAEARVETVFIRRRDAVPSGALRAFLQCARTPQPTR
jgi:LysR family transcriptional regulator, cell division regulator